MLLFLLIRALLVFTQSSVCLIFSAPSLRIPLHCHRDAPLFVWLEKNIDKLLARDAEAIAYAIERSCINKVRCARNGATGRAVDRVELGACQGW